MNSGDEYTDGFTQRSIDAYNQAVESGDAERIEQAKYSLLIDAISILGIVGNYITLEQHGIQFDFGVSCIHKGTRLYRIRSYQQDINFDDPCAWEPNPHRTQGRANRQGQEAMYLGSTEAVCLLETHTAIGQRYALGSYECSEDIVVGGFLHIDSTNTLHNIAGMVLNSLLIAPSREKRNSDLFGFLDRYYGQILLDDLCDLSCVMERGGLELPFKFGVLNQREHLHDLTNDICAILAEKTPDGIRYSSCFLPLEAPGIACSDYNLALYRSGIDKLKFLGCKIKTNESPLTSIDVAKCLIGCGR